jgi:hypothetical protein
LSAASCLAPGCGWLKSLRLNCSFATGLPRATMSSSRSWASMRSTGSSRVYAELGAAARDRGCRRL